MEGLLPESPGGEWTGPDEVRALCQAFTRGLREALGDKLYAAYIYGAVAFPEKGATCDVDFHVILCAAPDDRERSDLAALHSALALEFPPLGAELDGYYILLEDARQGSPPEHQLLPGVYDSSWALHCAHIRAGRCIVLCGPDPRSVYPEPSWQEQRTALQGEFRYVAGHLHDYPAYCVLNLCRLIYSFSTRDVVVSKRACAGWAEAAFPQWDELIESARRAYDCRMTGREDGLLQSGVEAFFAFAGGQLERVGEPSWPNRPTSPPSPP